MTTFQSIIFGIIEGFGQFLPIGVGAHHLLMGYVTGWTAPTGVLAGGLSFGALLALLVYFRHDWASMISCFLQVILFRKRPRTLDELLPLFLSLSSIPAALVWFQFNEQLAEIDWTPLLLAGTTAAFGLPLLFAEFLSKKKKGMFDWRSLDALTVGISQIALLVPGGGQFTGALTGGLLRHFNHEAACKYAYFCAAPALAVATYLRLRGLDFHAAYPAEGTTWLSFAIGTVVAFAAGLLAIGGFCRQAQRASFRQYAVYRLVLAAGIAALFWMRSRG